ncbi:MAG: 16S rRNA (cytosine(967)-C(5))-methyltransferase RsmB [Rubricoccaceae bacterium]
MSSSPRAREIAVHRLLRVEADGAYVARLSDRGIDPAEARRASDYVAGVTRWRRWLDHLIDRFYRGDIATLQPELLQVLRVGLYDLVIRETPPHAAVSEAVGTAKAMLHKGAAGLTNAVLRAASRQLDALAMPDTGDLADDLAVRFSHPTWMVRRWLERWSREDVEHLLAANNAAPTFGLRVNALRTTQADSLRQLEVLGVNAQPSRWLDDFVTTQQLQPILKSDALETGELAVQDEAAGLVVRALDPQPGDQVLDAAAAPGGKAIYTAIRMENTGSVHALDISEAKVRLIRDAAERHGTTIVETVAEDLCAWEHSRPFDRVLLDAPCSGTGVLAKRADLRWNRSPEDLIELAALQDALLDAAARHVCPGGLLAYSTCSIEPEENEHRIDSFLHRHPEFSRQPVGDLVPEAMRTSSGAYAALPHVHGTDGAFAARLVRSPS